MLFLQNAAVFLGAAVVAVALSRWIGLGSVLGYLVAGMVIGPAIFGVVGRVDDILHVAELGIVLLLFLIGLELQPRRLWSLRRLVFGAGAAQTLGTAVLIGVIALAFGLSWPTAVAVGLILAMSSTAFALQVMAERNELATRFGRLAFAILLFQDLAAIPMLAIMPLVGGPGVTIVGEDRLFEIVLVGGTVLGLIFGGPLILRTILKVVAATRLREVFTAMALLTVAGSALLVEMIGLSMALGAFLAGVLLADSEFRHQLEADIEPFKGLLLGLFFIAVGMSLNLPLLIAQPIAVAGATLGLLLVKGAVLYIVGRVSGLNNEAASRLATALPQGGEFAFVLFAVAFGANLLDNTTADFLVLVVTISMAVTPFLVKGRDWIAPRVKSTLHSADHEALPDDENQVIIAGFGRFGQIVGRVLRARKIPFTALDSSSHRIDFVRAFGNKVYYGDVTRIELLRAAKVDKAVAFVIAVDDDQATLKVAELLKREFPRVKVYARAHDRTHAHRLMDLKVDVIRRETFLSALDIAGEVLKGIGLPDHEADDTVERFRGLDETRLRVQHDFYTDQEKSVAYARKEEEELEQLFNEDAADKPTS
ncbi:MAG: glutathione-regulated potassium-efflux system protein KefB [Alphaproteobacteria bacterium]|nr:glutathione-regulated potassium-efflux system protein KefB [Alphaproteobacteria bacterium]